VQSRISNDIGGVQSVVTNTATSIASNVTTVVATMIGMLLLSWQLALFAFALIPLFVLLTRRVGKERRRIAKTTQETLADISSLVQESLSVSGILLGKTMGRGSELADRFDPLTMHVGVNTGPALLGATKIEGSAGTRWTYTASGMTTMWFFAPPRACTRLPCRAPVS